tara:strand:- start:298 stop:579 length:282 start_codon:yes stop_codon:yes gene_type:complete
MNNKFYKDYFNYITDGYGDVSLVAMKLQEGSQFGYYIIAGNWDGNMIAGYDHSARSTSEDGYLDLDVKQIIIGTYGSVAHLEMKISQYQNGEL